ncbi:MAG TPA: hypothetical protein VFK90_05595 [Anaeromyxobacter sp.]|nr:hypothetical protein [Anaeromyxobacter sp.]
MRSREEGRLAYHPPQRAVGAFILSLDHWIRATFHLAKLHAFEEHLARGRSFFSLTNVALGGGSTLEFLALRASAAHLVVPEIAERELLLQPVLGAQPREVSCYLEHVAVHGTLELPPGVRTSDFLAHQTGFIALRACRIVPALAGRREPIPVVFVNAAAILALAEEGAHVLGPPGEAARPKLAPTT